MKTFYVFLILLWLKTRTNSLSVYQPKGLSCHEPNPESSNQPINQSPINNTLMFKRQYIIVFAIVAIVLIIDQTLKFWIKTNFTLGQEVLPLGTEWFRLHFVENDGMAFGLKLGDSGSWGKLALTIFRLVAVTFLGLFMRSLLRKGEEFGFVCSLALVWAGAMGNIVDSMVYGQLFSESGMHAPALFLPSSGGYAPLLHGKVVDMFYFPMWAGMLPEWLPFYGGEYTEFFRPVFNFADAAISVGVALIIVGQLFFNRQTAVEDVAADDSANEQVLAQPDMEK